VYPQEVVSISVFGRGQRGIGSSTRVITLYIAFVCRRTQLSSASTLRCGSRQRRHCSMCKKSKAHDKGEFALSPVNGTGQNVQTRGHRRHTRNKNRKALLCLLGQLKRFPSRADSEARFHSFGRMNACGRMQTGPLASTRHLCLDQEPSTFKQMVESMSEQNSTLILYKKIYIFSTQDGLAPFVRQPPQSQHPLHGELSHAMCQESFAEQTNLRF